MKKAALIILICLIWTKTNAQKSIQSSMIDLITKDEYLFKKSQVDKTIILIDTFQFFTPELTGWYDSIYVKTYSEMPDLKKMAKNIFYISTIETTSNRALIVGVLQKQSNYQALFYFKISGRQVLLIKRTGGFF